MKGWASNEKFGNWDDVQTRPMPPDPGIYRARIASAEPEPTKTGKPSITLMVELFEDGEGNELPKPRKVRDTLVLTAAAAWRVKLLCVASDLEPPEDNSFETAEQFCSDLIKATKNGVFVKVKHETYTSREGEERVAARLDRYLTDEEARETSSEDSKSNGAANGAAAPSRRPRRGASSEEVNAS